MSGHGRHEAGSGRPDGEQFRQDMYRDSAMTDELASELLIQVVMLEEIIAARWPWRILVRARLRRDLRRSVEHVEGRTFTDRRIAALGSGWLGRRP